MDKGSKLKLDKLKALQGRAIASNHASLCLPVYRSIVSRTTETIFPIIEEFIDKYTNKIGRPGYNAAAYPIIKDIGSRKAAAISLTVVVNHFHAPHSYQSIATKIGAEIANEWVLQQEDPKLIANINKFRFGNIGTQRRMDYLRKTLGDIKGQALQTVDTVTRAAIGNILLGIILRTDLIKKERTNKRDVYNIRASSSVIEYLEKAINTQAARSPILGPILRPIITDVNSHFIKPQKGRYICESTVESNDCNIIRAANLLNSSKWALDEEQYNFIKECALSRTSILGLPYVFSGEFPRYTKEMSQQQKTDVKKLRAKLYSKKNKNTAQRVRLLSSLSMLSDYIGETCYFESQADFRGRLYLKSNLISYQGPDWLRSLWKFKEAQPIETKEQRNWLFIHAANCYGHNRISFEDRIAFILNNRKEIQKIANNPWEMLSTLEKAEDPFRFLAACREVSCFFTEGYGYQSSIPVQMDATSQGIQIWSTLAEDIDLMKASNVIADGTLPKDIYQDLADTINDSARTSNNPDCTYFRRNPIDRKLAKSALIIIPYGGTIYAIRELVDSKDWDAPFRARGWLSKELWEQARDILHSIVKCQERASQAVRTHLKDNPGTRVYEWDTPNGLHVRQRYMKDKRIRIKNALDQTIHSYRIETDSVDIRRSALAFPPNFIHSLDSSILCLGLINSNSNHSVKDFMAIHDCVGVHASYAQDVHTELSMAFKEVLNSQNIFQFLSFSSCNGLKGRYNGGVFERESVKLSRYLFS